MLRADAACFVPNFVKEKSSVHFTPDNDVHENGVLGNDKDLSAPLEQKRCNRRRRRRRNIDNSKPQKCDKSSIENEETRQFVIHDNEKSKRDKSKRFNPLKKKSSSTAVNRTRKSRPCRSRKKTNDKRDKSKINSFTLDENSSLFPPLTSLSLSLPSVQLNHDINWSQKLIQSTQNEEIRSDDLELIESNGNDRFVITNTSRVPLMKLFKRESLSIDTETDAGMYEGSNDIQNEINTEELNAKKIRESKLLLSHQKYKSKDKSALWMQLIEDKRQQKKTGEWNQSENIDQSSCCSCSSSYHYEYSHSSVDSSEISSVVSFIDNDFPLHIAVSKSESLSLTSILGLVDIEESTDWESISHYCNQTQKKIVQEGKSRFPGLSVLSALTAAHLAIWLDRPQFLKIILDYDSRILHALDGYCWTPLMLACALSRDGCVQVIMSYSTKVVFAKHSLTGNNAIHLCCKYGDLVTLRYVLTALYKSSGSKHQYKCFSCQNNDGQTPWHIICENNRMDMVEMFMTVWVTPSLKGLTMRDKFGYTPFIAAIYANAIDIVSLLLMRAFDGNIVSGKCSISTELCPTCPICIAVNKHSVEMVNLLMCSYDQLFTNVNIEKALQDAVNLAKCDEKHDIVITLITAGAKPHAGIGMGLSPLLRVATRGDFKLLEKMIDTFKEARRLSRSAREEACELRGYSIGYFDEIDTKEDNVFDEAVREALLVSLIESWRIATADSKNIDQVCNMLDTSLILLNRGVVLTDSSLNRLLSFTKKLQGNSLEQRKIASPLISSNNSYEGCYTDFRLLRANNVSLQSKNNKAQLDWLHLYFQLPWVKDNATNDVYCPWVMKLLERSQIEELVADTKDDDIFHLSLKDVVIPVHKSVVSVRCEKLAAAIQFETLNRRFDSSNEDMLCVYCDLDYKSACFLLEHCYIGSIISRLPVVREDCCKVLLNMAYVANEYICPSLLLECELRLLSAKPYSCFCPKCSTTKMSTEGLPLVRLFSKGPSLLISGSTALEIITTAHDIASMPIILDNNCRVRKTFCAKNTLQSNGGAMDNDGAVGPYPFYFAKILSLRSVLLDFRRLENSNIFRNYRDEYAKENGENNPKTFSHELILSCIDELSAIKL